jgi:predicted component of type VI protein secretion system
LDEAMTLTLTIVRCPHGETPPARTLTDGTFTIGRAQGNDWALPDPDRFLSKRHCAITLQGATWELADNSANGTYLNRDPEPIGAGQARDLRDGDRVLIGDYEIEVRIAEPARSAPDTSHIMSPAPFASALRELDPPENAFTGPVQSDHSPGVEDAFRPPRPAVLLGEDWDLDGSKVLPGRAIAPPPVMDHPLAQSETDLMAAFLRGAALPDARPESPERSMEALGAAFRALVKGLREALVMRAASKREFRIRETMIRSHGNNPLKFAASEDDALVALLGVGRRTDMGPAQAVSEAMCDIRLHELASIAAMQTAVRGLLRELAPAKLREEARGGGMLESQRKARAWDLYEAHHARLSQGFADDFDSVFGRAFALAYERALEEARSARSRS